MPPSLFYKKYYSRKSGPLERPEYGPIISWIPRDAKVLDIGCGEGSLGYRLIREKGCEVYGVDICESGVSQAVAKGVKASVTNVDDGLDYKTSSFDIVVINVVLQMVYRPEFVLNEALRVGKQVIVSFPNFGFILNRLQLLIFGVFPQYPLYGYAWYDTRHIHLFSYKDLCIYATKNNLTVTKKKFFKWNSRTADFLSTTWPNMFSSICILCLEKNSALSTLAES